MVSADASGSMGHDVLENPQETLRSMIDAGRDGADLARQRRESGREIAAASGRESWFDCARVVGSLGVGLLRPRREQESGGPRLGGEANGGRVLEPAD